MSTQTIEIAAQLRLKKGEERRLAAGHLWIFSNEIDTAVTPLQKLVPGAWVELISQRGKNLGVAYANPKSLIAARWFNPHRFHLRDLLQQRLQRAWDLRERLYNEPFYRWVYGESDQLPGLVVDRFDHILVVQCNTAGIDAMRDTLLELLSGFPGIQHILLKNDSSMRELEGLARQVEWLGPKNITEINLMENGLHYTAPLHDGQKTGWFFDQRDNRRQLQQLYSGARVLDLYSYLGAWGISAAKAGAKAVTCVDSAPYAIDYIRRNAAANGCEQQVNAVQADVEQLLRDYAAAGEKFDVVVLDPPAFIKRRKDSDKGEAAYQRVNRLALSVLADDGYLISCSCSHHLPAERLQRLLQKAGDQESRQLQILAAGQQSADHPVHPAMPETAYLKAFYLRAGKR